MGVIYKDRIPERKIQVNHLTQVRDIKRTRREVKEVTWTDLEIITYFPGGHNKKGLGK